MTRRIVLLAALVAAALPISGCAVSLFSGSKRQTHRIDALEHRMDHVEDALHHR